MGLTAEQRRAVAIHGYVVVPGVIGEDLLRAADAEVDALAAESPAPAGTVGPHFYFLAPGRLPSADAARRDSGALALADELVAPHRLDHALDHVQVALNIPPYSHRPGAPHIDGHRPDEPIGSFTMLAAIVGPPRSSTCHRVPDAAGTDRPWNRARRRDTSSVASCRCVWRGSTNR